MLCVNVESFERGESAFKANVPLFGRVAVEVYGDGLDFGDDGGECHDALLEILHHSLALLCREFGLELKEYDMFQHRVLKFL
jgi:hypothetical protein